jgi:pyridoxal phosphate enzyme (YggS family)
VELVGTRFGTSRERRDWQPRSRFPQGRNLHGSEKLPGRKSVQARLKHNRTQVLERIAAAARAAGRDPSEVELVAVTKSATPEMAAELYEAGCTDLGENRASALEEKHAAFLKSGRIARWHFVGHLQRNKARRVLRIAHAIHSVDSMALWEALARLAEEERRSPGIYLQVKLADEAAKSGLAPEELPALIERARSGPLPLLGLMVMAPLSDDPMAATRMAREVFERANRLARTLPGSAFVHGRARLSMGMSADYEEAVRAGSHVVRIGGALFDGVLAGAGRNDA